MADKALISEFTWRSLEMQRHAFPDMPHFVAPDELSSLLRQTRRAEKLVIHVMSLAVIADNENDFRLFLASCRERNYSILDKEKNFHWHPEVCKSEAVVKLWRAWRKEGSAKIGGQISADKRKAKSASGAAAIQDRWGQPSKDWPTHVLLKESDLSYNTAITQLGKRPIAQYNYQAKLKRKANAKR